MAQALGVYISKRGAKLAPTLRIKHLAHGGRTAWCGRQGLRRILTTTPRHGRPNLLKQHVFFLSL